MTYLTRLMPRGGVAGEVITKVSGTDADVEWSAPGSGSLPVGGTLGQVLTKQSGADGDADWETPGGGSGLTHPQVMTRASFGGF